MPTQTTLASKAGAAQLAAACVLALSLAGCGGSKEGAAAGGTPPPTPVGVVTLKAGPMVQQRELPGRAAASLVAEVRPQVGGIVRQRLFTEGGLVRAGQPLYQLDDASYRADAASAKATLARASATLASAKLTATRSAELVQIDAVSRQDNDAAQAALAQAEADLAAAQAAVQRAGVTLGFAQITAPIAGRIGLSSVTQGALVTAGQANALATIQRMDPMHIELTQSSAEMLALRRAQASGALGGSATEWPVKLLMEDGSTYPHPGKLTFADAAVDPATGSVALRVVVPNPEGLLLPGVYLRAVVGEGERAQALLVPQRAVSRDPKGNASVMRVAAGNRVEVVPVRVSRTVGDQWLVESGLASGDRVIIEGLQKVAPGATVQPQEAAASAPAAAPKAASAAPAATPAASAGASASAAK